MASTKVTLKIGLTNNTSQDLSFTVPNGKDGLGTSLNSYQVTITSTNQASIPITKGLTPIAVYVNGLLQNSSFWSFASGATIIELSTGLVVNDIVSFIAYN